MRDYGRVYSSFWTSPTIQLLTDGGRTLALYLLTGPHSTIAGVCRLPDGYVCEDLRWSTERVSDAFGELFRTGFANRCETTKWVWVCKFLEWNKPENPNQWKAARKVAQQVPTQCSWGAEFSRALEAIDGNVALYRDSSSSLPQLFSKPSPTQEQKQKQKQDQDQNQEESPAQACSRGRVERVFEHWKNVHQHSKAALDRKRRVMITEALKSYDEQTLKNCISGYKNSPHHTGDNERNTRYDTIELMLRDAKHIDMGLQFFQSPPKAASAMKELTSEEREWKQVRDEAASEGFRTPAWGESIDNYRVALDRFRDLRAREVFARMQKHVTSDRHTPENRGTARSVESSTLEMICSPSYRASA